MTSPSKPTPSAGSPGGRGARIAAIGTYVPERVVTNADMARIVDTTDDWIVRRTGIHERHFAAPDEFTSHLCVAAARDLMSRYDVDPATIDFVIACTSTPDYGFPSVACIAQDRLGLSHAGAMDINATCAGFVYGLHTANAFVRAGLHRTVLVLAGETLTKVTDYSDRTTCVLFGDGAGAALVTGEDGPGRFRASLVGSNGAGAANLYRTGLSSCIGGVQDNPSGPGGGLIHQNGREVYRWAVETVCTGVAELLASAGLSADDLDWFVPHSANNRIIEAVCERLGFPPERTLSSIAMNGNTSAATIPLALRAGQRAEKLRPGQLVLMYGFGGGLVHAGMIVEW
jgi:3-oxoacyl-[acyl-carrier-protein] synthase III